MSARSHQSEHGSDTPAPHIALAVQAAQDAEQHADALCRGLAEMQSLMYRLERERCQLEARLRSCIQLLRQVQS